MPLGVYPRNFKGILTCKICKSTESVKRFQSRVPLCWKHYLQMRRHGRILKRTKFEPNEFVDYGNYIEIILYAGNGEAKEVARAVIDKSQFSRVKKHKWHLAKRSKDGAQYVETSIGKGKGLFLHHFILGKRPGFEVDHGDGDGLNNRKGNLRFVTHKQNMLNRTRKLSRSGAVGVYWRKARNYWIAMIQVGYTKIYLGCSKDLEEAIKLRKAGECKYWGMCS